MNQRFRWLCVEPEALAEPRRRKSATATVSKTPMICDVGKWVEELRQLLLLFQMAQQSDIQLPLPVDL